MLEIDASGHSILEPVLLGSLALFLGSALVFFVADFYFVGRWLVLVSESLKLIGTYYDVVDLSPFD